MKFIWYGGISIIPVIVTTPTNGRLVYDRRRGCSEILFFSFPPLSEGLEINDVCSRGSKFCTLSQ